MDCTGQYRRATVGTPSVRSLQCFRGGKPATSSLSCNAGIMDLEAGGLLSFIAPRTESCVYVMRLVQGESLTRYLYRGR